MSDSKYPPCQCGPSAMMKLRDLIQARRSLNDSGPESHAPLDDDDDRPELGFYSKSLGIPPTRTRPGRARNVHDMLVDMREDSKALTEEERTANKGPSVDPIQFDKTIREAKDFALKERNRNVPSPVPSAISSKKSKKKKVVKFDNDGMKSLKIPQFTKGKLYAVLQEQDKENLTHDSEMMQRKQFNDSKRLFKLSTHGDLKTGVDKSIPASYRLRPHCVGVSDWTTPTFKYIPSPAVPLQAPGPRNVGNKKPPPKPKPPPNRSYWTGNSNQDENTLLNMLNKLNTSGKSKKKVRFDVPEKRVRFNIPEENEAKIDEEASLYQKEMKKIQKGPLPRHLNNISPINAVDRFNYFSEVWTMLEDLFSDETIQWMNGSPEAECQNIFSIPPHSMASFATFESKRRVQLLSKGFEHAEVLFNIPKPSARLKTTESRDIHMEYAAVKEKMLCQAFNPSKFPSDSRSCFTDKYSKHWTFLACLLTDAILRKRVLNREYTEFECNGSLWEDYKPENSRVCFWESKFEKIAGEVLGGQETATGLLSAREFTLLRCFFNVNIE